MPSVVDRLTAEIARLKRQALSLAETATDLDAELRELRRLLRDDTTGRLAAAINAAMLKAASERRRATRRAASRGARTIEWHPARGGAQMARVDGSAWFRLTRKDAALLRLLTEGRPLAADGFPEWLTYEELSTALGQKTGTAPTRRAIVESVYRIRKELRSVDVNEYLVEVDRVKGRVRFLASQL